MCLSKTEAEKSIIRVGEKTNKAKYEFLRLYYTVWNQITKARPRIIIDTHAGSGLVELIGEKNLLNNLLAVKSAFFALVIFFSTNLETSLLLASVVFIFSFRTRALARDIKSAFL